MAGTVSIGLWNRVFLGQKSVNTDNASVGTPGNLVGGRLQKTRILRNKY